MLTGASGSARLRVTLQTAEVEHHAGLLADDPGVVPRRHVKRLAWPELALAAVVHPQRHAAFQDVADVVYLARIGPGDRLDVLRPAPARLEDAAPDRVAVQVDQLDAARALRELPHLIRVLEALSSKLCHGVLLPSVALTLAAGRPAGKRTGSRSPAGSGRGPHAPQDQLEVAAPVPSRLALVDRRTDAAHERRDVPGLEVARQLAGRLGPLDEHRAQLHELLHIAGLMSEHALAATHEGASRRRVLGHRCGIRA